MNQCICKHRDCILLLIVSKAELHGQFPYLENYRTGYKMDLLQSREPITRNSIGN